MKGYFSTLIRHTGIPVSSANEPAAHAVEPQRSDLTAPHEGTQIHVEEERFVEPQVTGDTEAAHAVEPQRSDLTAPHEGTQIHVEEERFVEPQVTGDTEDGVELDTIDSAPRLAPEFIRRDEQQSAIDSIETGTDLQSGESMPSSGQTQGTPVEDEDSMPPEPPQETRENSRDSVVVTQVENIQDSTRTRFESQIPEELPPAQVTERATVSEEQDWRDADANLPISERDVQRRMDTVRPQPEINRREPLEAVETTESGPAGSLEKNQRVVIGQRHTQSPVEPVGSIAQDRQEVVSEPMTTTPNEQESPQPTWNNAFRAVREWVADSAGLDVEIPQNSRVDTDGISESTDQTDHWSTVNPRQIERESNQTPEFQDFQISIGTIQLTVEEPQQEIRREEPQPIQKARQATHEDDSTRLSRYYLT